MKKKKERLRNKIKKLNVELAVIEANRQLTYERITGVDSTRFRIVNDDFLTVTCETFEELQKVIANIKPFKNGWEINHTGCRNITSLYRVDLINGARGDSQLKIQITNKTGSNYWFSLDVTCLPSELFTAFCVNTQRSPSDSERHCFDYVGNAEFKAMLIPCVRFSRKQVGWYGGDVTLISEDCINELIDAITNVKLWERLKK